MAGRGRGKTTFTREQLEMLGVGKDMQVVVTAPPPTYAPLRKKIPLPQLTEKEKAQALWGDNFIIDLHNSNCYVVGRIPIEQQNADLKKPNDFFGDIYGKPLKKSAFHWTRMPSELWPTRIRRVLQATEEKSIQNHGSESKKPRLDIEQRLKQLEAIEERVSDKKPVEVEESDKEEEILSDDADDDNDYEVNYFDNGEGMNDDDEPMDDGPIF